MWLCTRLPTGGCPPGFPVLTRADSVVSLSRLPFPRYEPTPSTGDFIFSRRMSRATVFLVRFPFRDPPRASRDRLLRDAPSRAHDGGVPQGAPMSVTFGPVVQVIGVLKASHLLPRHLSFQCIEDGVSLLFTHSRRG